MKEFLNFYALYNKHFRALIKSDSDSESSTPKESIQDIRDKVANTSLWKLTKNPFRLIGLAYRRWRLKRSAKRIEHTSKALYQQKMHPRAASILQEKLSRISVDSTQQQTFIDSVNTLVDNDLDTKDNLQTVLSLTNVQASLFDEAVRAGIFTQNFVDLIRDYPNDIQNIAAFERIIKHEKASFSAHTKALIQPGHEDNVEYASYQSNLSSCITTLLDADLGEKKYTDWLAEDPNLDKTGLLKFLKHENVLDEDVFQAIKMLWIAPKFPNISQLWAMCKALHANLLLTKAKIQSAVKATPRQRQLILYL